MSGGWRHWRRVPQREREAIVAELSTAFKCGVVNWGAAEERYGVDRDTLRYQCDAPYRAELLARNVANRNRRKGGRSPDIKDRVRGGGNGIAAEYRTNPSDVAARLAEIPEDTRTPAQRLMGDPMPGDNRRTRYG